MTETFQVVLTEFRYQKLGETQLSTDASVEITRLHRVDQRDEASDVLGLDQTFLNAQLEGLQATEDQILMASVDGIRPVRVLSALDCELLREELQQLQNKYRNGKPTSLAPMEGARNKNSMRVK